MEYQDMVNMLKYLDVIVANRDDAIDNNINNIKQFHYESEIESKYDQKWLLNMHISHIVKLSTYDSYIQ